MSTEKNVQTVKDFFAAIGRGDREGLPDARLPPVAVASRRDVREVVGFRKADRPLTARTRLSDATH
jgi:ketosteroid isomerase-like protein